MVTNLPNPSEGTQPRVAQPASSGDDLLAVLPHRDLRWALDGFRLGGRRYDSPAMTFRGQRCPYTSGMWPVYFHPANPKFAWVRATKAGPFLQLEVVDQPDVDRPARS